MNTVILMGRLTADPEVISSASGTTVARFSIAVDRRFKREGEPTADFFSCVSFGKQAEFVDKYLHKATKIVLSGHLQNDSYTNKDGRKITSTVVYVDSVEFAESKSADAPKEKTNNDDFLKVDDIADLPFA
jgi:single-strand DNA-binding protein